MKKGYIIIPIFTFFLIFQLFILFADEESNVIGIVFSVKGDLILKNVTGKEEIKPGVKVFKESEILLTEGSGRGKIQIITSQGPVVYTRFPVTFKEVAFAGLSDKQQDNYLASIGGTVLTGRASDADKNFLEDEDFDEEPGEADDIFDWYMEPGLLAEEDIEKGFTIVLSKERSSKENFSLHPLYFKFHRDVDFTDISFEIMKDNTFITVYKNGMFIKDGSDYVFSFDCFEYQVDTPYILEVAITFSDDSIEYREFGYTIAGNNKIKEIEAEISRENTGSESDFEKNLIRAKVYRKYNMKLKAMEILANLGLDIEDMF